MSQTYDRNLIGYGSQPPKTEWPNQSRIAVQFVINYEEGGENCLLHGDNQSEAFLSEIVGAQYWPNQRHMNMESIYEYGSRAGFWRLNRLFNQFKMPVTVFGVAMALQRNPDVVDAMLQSNWEIASHGYRWIDYKDVPENLEREHIETALSVHTELVGKPPAGWYIGRTSENSRRLILETTTPLYDADSYADDLPYWVKNTASSSSKNHLIIPYTLDANDMRFATAQGFNNGEQFFQYLKDSFDVLYAEGIETPKMMSIGLHCRLAGRPGRIAGLKRFLEYIQMKQELGNDVWICTREQIAQHWHRNHTLS
ncbi:allantoinase PuuE [Thiomicrorhabdus indica]|uniref:allantoinase PuuE n=1 Tax=Thiomicrorhabdus indica TaxID=2267253 RepID=UPI002AA6B2EB|nr:allantoinase PuuE [Thiomicrorhabdus indica]